MNYLSLARHYFAITARDLWKHRGNNLINLLGLSVAIACFTLCLYVARGITSVDDDFPGADRSYVIADSARRYTAAFEHTLGAAVARDFPDAEQYATVEFHLDMLFEAGDNKEFKYMLRAMEVTPTFFDFFSIEFLDGARGAVQQANTVILFESTARKIFGGVRESIGQTAYIRRELPQIMSKGRAEQDVAYAVRGVIPDLAYNSRFRSRAGEIHLLLVNDENGQFSPSRARGGWSGAQNFVRLRPGADVGVINRALAPYSKKFTGNFHFEDARYYLLPYGEIPRNGRDVAYALAGVISFCGLLILLASLFNHAARVITSFLDKRRECAIRESAGAGHWATFFFFYTGAAIAILLAAGLSACWIQLLLPRLTRVTDAMNLTFDFRAILLQLLQYALAGLLAAFLLLLLPVRRIVRRDGDGKRPRQRARTVLLGLQLFISIFFISATLIARLQLDYFSSITLHTISKDDRKRVLEVSLDQSLLAPRVEEVRSALRALPAVEEVIAAEFGFASGAKVSTWIQYEGREFERPNCLFVEPEFLAFTNTRLLEGRAPRDGNEVVVNETARRLFEKEEVVGERIKTYNREFTVVGVAEDVLYTNTKFEMSATFFLPCSTPRYLYARVHPDRIEDARKQIEGIIRAYLPTTIDYSLPTIEESVADIAVMENLLARLIAILTIISVIISLTGVYTSMLLATERRRKEVAIRKINGAALPVIIALFLRPYFIVLLAAAIPAFALCHAAAASWVETYAFRAPVPWWLYPLVFIALAALLAAVTIRQLVKTARANPADILKTE